MHWVQISIISFAAVSAPLIHADTLSALTVEAQREHDALRTQVDQFFNSTFQKSPFDQSLLRWGHAVCPLAAGMSRPIEEFVLMRLSQRARESGVPLGKNTCKPANLFIIVAKNPETFLKVWWHQHPLMYTTTNGVQPVKRFIETSRPIRVWYNVGPSDDNAGTALQSISAAPNLALTADPGGLGSADYPVIQGPATQLGSRLSYTLVRNISSAIVIIDPAQIMQLNVGQLADYLSMVSFAEINQDADPGAIPTILNVFAPHRAPPLELTDWDKALLRSLYATPQSNRLQMSEMESTATKALTSKSLP